MANVLLGLCLTVILLSGCAGQLVGKLPTVENDNFATIHIARPSGFTACGGRMTIQIDYEDFYYIACGDNIAFRVPVGKPITLSQTTSLSPDHLEINPEKGKDYYFEKDCNGWGICWLQETKESKFNQLVKRCDNSIKLGY